MDLDALGLNSTFASTDLEHDHEPVDRVETSDIEGPDDFTMNMTYWMTADLPLSHIKSRKEAKGKRHQVRTDARHTDIEDQTSVGDGDDDAIIEEDSRGRRYEGAHSATPTMPANSTADKRAYSKPPSEPSMQNDEKVRSFLSALPDTDMDGAITGTPLHVPKQSFLQVPRSSPPKARSLQPTVEDYDTTPRKPTQETVIHHRHASPAVDAGEKNSMRDRIAELESQIRTQELAAKTRITELETILSYTRTELESVRTDNYKNKEMISSFERDMEKQKNEHEKARLSAQVRLKAQEEAQGAAEARMQDYGEELHQQNLSKLQAQREDFEGQLRALEESKRAVDEELTARGQTLENVQAELAQLKQPKKQEDQHVERKQPEKHQQGVETAQKEREELSKQLSAVQTRADDLQAELEKATADARAAREDAQNWNTMHTDLKAKHHAQKSRNSDLEEQLRSAHFELECAQADIAAKQQLFQTNLNLNSQLRELKAKVEAHDTGSTITPQQRSDDAKLESRIDSLQSQLESCRADLADREQQISHHTKSQEQFEQRLSTAQGRIEGLETAIAALRQQLAESHRSSAKAQAEIERLEGDLEDANDRLQDAHAEAARRVADVEKKLNAMKEKKMEVENKNKDLQSQNHDLTQKHEAMMEDVRDTAEDAVRKAGLLLDQERNEKKRIVKDLHRAKADIAKLQAEAAQKVAEEASDNESSTVLSYPDSSAKDAEIANLRDIIRRQVAETKTLKSETAALRKENKTLKAAETSLPQVTEDLQSQLLAAKTEIANLQSQLKTQAEDFAAINAAMDERLATALSKLIKERAKTVIGKRDGQWAESVGKIQSEKELLGKVLLRQWGREEVGAADEKNGEKQGFAYKYVKRS